MSAVAHAPVLASEIIEILRPQAGGVFVDATFGRGGHARQLLERLGGQGRILLMDQDPQAIDKARHEFDRDARTRVVKQSFKRLADTVSEWGLSGRVDGVLFDLGVSSPQLDDPARGFSFRADGPLDMRMDPSRGEHAAHWLARAAEQEIAGILWRYGEERYSRRIARAIVRARAERPIETTAQLAALVCGALPRLPRAKPRDKHPATRTFQAIRIHINGELDALAGALPQVFDVLRPGGRLAVISFHSLEDRIVKRFLRREARGDRFPPEVPIRDAQREPRLHRLCGPITPGAEELAGNPRARSAVLRGAQTLGACA